MQPSRQSMEAAERAARGEDPTGGALFFYNPSKGSTYFLQRRPRLAVIGNHVFLG